MYMDDSQYKAYLKSQEWALKVQQRLGIDDSQCQCCGCRGTSLNPLEIHHLHYRTIGEEDVYSDIVTLCRACHKGVHKMLNRIISDDGTRGWSSLPQVHVWAVSTGVDISIGKG